MTQKLIACAVTLCLFGVAHAAQGPQALTSLAAQSVLHVETSLKKINAAGPTGDKSKTQREVIVPAGLLLKEWREIRVTDLQKQPFMACQGIFGDIQVYAADALQPPKYHLSNGAVQKLKFINEDLVQCRKAAANKV